MRELDPARGDDGFGDRYDLAFGQRGGIGGEAGAPQEPFAVRSRPGALRCFARAPDFRQ